jgi:hypothetical protein
LHLLVAAVAGAAEVYLGRALPDTFEFSFGKGRSPAAATEDWAPLLDALLPFASGQLGPVFDGGGLRRKEAVVAGINNFRAVVASTKRANRDVFEEFGAKVSGVTI